MKQLFAKPSPNPDSEFLFHQLISYAEFPPIVPPIMAKNYIVERKRAGGFIVSGDDNKDISADKLEDTKRRVPISPDKLGGKSRD